MARLKLGVFGGTFDPPHNGHLALAEAARQELRLDRVLWVLTPVPPHKTDRRITPLDDRLAMLEAALANHPEFILSHVDIVRPPPHYAVDTMRLLRAQFPGAWLIYLMGGDSLRDLPQWHAPRDFVAACDALGVMRRPGARFDLAALEKALPGIAEKIRLVEAPLIKISASEIRRRLRAGEAVDAVLPPAVIEIITRRRLYVQAPEVSEASEV